jgi:hypothetical protein
MSDVRQTNVDRAEGHTEQLVLTRSSSGAVATITTLAKKYALQHLNVPQLGYFPRSSKSEQGQQSTNRPQETGTSSKLKLNLVSTMVKKRYSHSQSMLSGRSTLLGQKPELQWGASEQLGGDIMRLVRVKSSMRVRTLDQSLSSNNISREPCDFDSVSSIIRTIDFKDVTVREYNITVGDNPSCSCGPPLRYVLSDC